MSTPTIVDVPHTLGREEARRRLRTRIGELANFVPGGMAEVHSSWPTEDRMALEVSAMGQSVSGTLDVQDRIVRVTLYLPAMLGFMSGMIASAIKDKGGQLLLSDYRPG